MKTNMMQQRKIKAKPTTMPKKKKVNTFAWYTIATDFLVTPQKKLTMGTKVLGSKPKVNNKGKMAVTLYGVAKDKKGHSINKVVSFDKVTMLRYMPIRRYKFKQNVLISNNPKKSFKKGYRVSGMPFKKNNVALVRIVNAYRGNDGKYHSKDVPLSLLEQLPTRVAPKINKASKPLTPSKKLMKPMRLDRMPMKKPTQVVSNNGNTIVVK